MIQSLRITNFQSHKSTELQFHKGVNVIVGGSDSGKSAILRALRWLIWNRPMGEAFRSTWGGETSVRADFAEDFYITRNKGEGKNAYYYISPTDDKAFKALKNEVPEEIQNLINIDRTNFQQQLDSPFLIGNTPGEVSAYFNKIAHLDQIDTSLKSIQSEIRKFAVTTATDQERLDTLNKELQAYEYLTKFEVDLDQLEADIKTRNGLAASKTAITGVVRELQGIDNAMVYDQETVALEPKVIRLQEMIAKKEQAVADAEDIKYGVGMLKSYKEAQNNHASVLSQEKLVDNILEMMGFRAVLQGNVDSADIILKEIHDADSMINQITQEIVDMEEVFSAQMPDECPLCGTQLYEDKAGWLNKN